MKFVIMGTPLPQARHRSTLFDRKIINYDPQKTIKKNIKNLLKAQVKWILDEEDIEELKELKNLSESTGFKVRLKFYMPIPKSTSKPKVNEMLWKLESPTTCDLDNLAKFILDCCNGILFKDDRNINLLECSKYYSNKPRTEIIIMESPEKKLDAEVKKILSIFSPEDLSAFIKDVLELCKLISVDQNGNVLVDQYGASLMDLYTGNWMLDPEDEAIVWSPDIQQMAKVISKIADNYGTKFKKVCSATPEYWKEKERYSDGKIHC